MFNHGKFNRKHFNLPGLETTDFIIRAVWASDFEAGARIGEDIRYSQNQSGTVHSNAVAASMVEASLNGAEEIGAGVVLRADYSFGITSRIEINAHVKPALNIAIDAATIIEHVYARAKAGQDISAAEAFAAAARCLLKLGADFTAPEVSFEGAVYSIISTAVFDTYTVSVNVRIPAGGKLIIDSDNYVVLLNGTNAIDKHSGDWLLLDRNVDKIQVTPHSSTIKSSLLYTERFL